MPVRELQMSAAERKRIAAQVKNAFSGKGRDLRKAAKLFSDFTGYNDPKVVKVRVPARSKIMLLIGDVDGILYTTSRDGQIEKYIHRFKRKARPQLLASPDGTQLYLIGGSYDFTERGIVDQS